MTISSSLSASKVDYKINNVIIERCDFYKDLGVVYQKDFRFDLQLKEIVNKTSKRLRLIKRFCQNITDIDLIRMLYLTYVRSHITSSLTVWSPKSREGIEKLEKIQKKFIKFLCVKMNIEFHRFLYVPILQLLDLPSIEKLIYIQTTKILYNLMNGKICSPFLSQCIKIKVHTFNARKKQTFLTKIYKATYLERNVVTEAMRYFNENLNYVKTPSGNVIMLDLQYHHWSAIYECIVDL